MYQEVNQQEDYIDSLIEELKDNIKTSKEILIRATRKSIRNIRPERKVTKAKKQKWNEKRMYGDFKR